MLKDLAKTSEHFNIRHSLWEPTAGNPRDGEDLLGWTCQGKLALLRTQGIPTHGRSSVINLAWGNGALIFIGTTTRVLTDFPRPADHEALGTELPWDNTAVRDSRPPLRPSTMDQKLFLHEGSTDGDIGP